MKRFLVLMVLALLIPSMVLGLGNGLKKVLMLVNNEDTYTGWMKFAIGTMITQGGGTYESLPYCTAQNPDSLAAALARARTSGKYGLVIIVIQEPGNLVYSPQAYNGNGVAAKWCNMGLTQTATVAPIGIPTLVCGYQSMVRDTTHTAKFYSGAGPGLTTDWSYGGVTDDSMWCKTSQGDTLIYHMGVKKQVVYMPLTYHTTPYECAFPWTYDIFVNDRKSTRGKGSSICLWHVNATAHDAAQVPGNGQDSVIYYLPNWGTNPGEYNDGPLKATFAILKRFNCIHYLPVGVQVYDYGYNIATLPDTSYSTYYARIDSFQDWCANKQIPVTYYTDACDADPNIALRMQGLLNIGYCAFEWHPSNLYKDGTTNPDSLRNGVFGSWPIKVTRDKGLVLKRNLVYDRAQMTSRGMLALSGFTQFAGQSGNNNGKAGYILADTIWTAMAAAGVRTVMVDPISQAWFVPGSAGYVGLGYPHAKFPVDLTWTGTASTANLKILALPGAMYGTSVTADSQYANPGRIRAKTIWNGNYSGSSLTHSSFFRIFLGNGRGPDQNQAFPALNVGSNWPFVITGEERGFAFAGAAPHFKVHLGSWQNMGWNWMKNYYNNLNAYNNLAKAGTTTIGDPFRWMYVNSMPQRINERM